MIALREEILEALNLELEEARKRIDFRVRGRKKRGENWTVTVDLEQSFGPDASLDESMEGALACWPGPPRGAADILSVIPEKEQVNLRFSTGPPPVPGGSMVVEPPVFLQALKSYWGNVLYAADSLNWFRQVSNSNPFDSSKVLSQMHFPELRKGQVQCFQLPAWKAGFLWGPPGTGKTYTIGALLAQYLFQFPAARILLLSTTNSAVDLALISVDQALERLSVADRAADRLRHQCARVGSHFVAGSYRNREHLLPVEDFTLIRRLAELEAARPSREGVERFSVWKRQVEEVRYEMRQEVTSIASSARLAAATTTSALFSLAQTKGLPIERDAQLHQVDFEPPYDLVVFDEASQVSLSHSLALAPLGKSVLFAGDPMQLPPIVRSEEPIARRWLGRSAFSLMDEKSEETCFLDEQSRMVEPICRVVSQVFYRGRLRVAESGGPEEATVGEERPTYGASYKTAQIMGVTGIGEWSQKFGGPIRPESASLIKDLISNLRRGESGHDILVLTPFRAQRVLIRSLLKKSGLSSVTVSTVHRAQGTEREIVIFDPVNGESRFLQQEKAANLINVALSRAKRRLFIVLSPADRRNILLDRIARTVEGIKEPGPASDAPLEVHLL